MYLGNCTPQITKDLSAIPIPFLAFWRMFIAAQLFYCVLRKPFSGVFDEK
jgi:hypothetical protein